MLMSVEQRASEIMNHFTRNVRDTDDSKKNRAEQDATIWMTSPVTVLPAPGKATYPVYLSKPTFAGCNYRQRPCLKTSMKSVAVLAAARCRSNADRLDRH